MTAPIGFVILTHSDPEQVLFLCKRLTTQFQGPPIAVHHDFSKCDLDKSRFPENVRFVPNWSRTSWGGFGIVDGALKALNLLYQIADPNWFTLLSGTDYPIKPREVILKDLNSHDFDAYIDHRQIVRCTLPLPAESWGDQNYIHPAWVRLAFERYMAIGFGFYKLAKRLGWRRKAIYLRSNFFIRHFTPFRGKTECYAGDFWFTANRKCARLLLAENEKNRKIIAHFQRRPVPDEGLFQTLLCNAPNLKLSTDNKRFTDWAGCVNHPRTLTKEDFPRLLISGDHFARKFAFDPNSLQQLDLILDAESPSDSTAYSRNT